MAMTWTSPSVAASSAASASASASASTSTPTSTDKDILQVVQKKFIDGKIAEVKEKHLFFDEVINELKIKEIVGECKKAREAAITVMIKRQQKMVILNNAWEMITDKRNHKDTFGDFLEPYTSAITNAQDELKALPKEKVAEALVKYCKSLSEVANIYQIAVGASTFEIEKLIDVLYFF